MKTVIKMMALAGLFTSLSASASYDDWGVHGLLEGDGNIVGMSFVDIYEFELTTNNVTLSAVAVSNNNASLLNLSNGVVTLFALTTDDNDWTNDFSLGSFVFSGATGSTPNLYQGLNAGHYYYKVTGNGDGALGGTYVLTSAVPEAETWAMMAMGLGLVGLQLRRRKNAEKIA